jgi:hypothetical protein
MDADRIRILVDFYGEVLPFAFKRNATVKECAEKAAQAFNVVITETTRCRLIRDCEVVPDNTPIGLMKKNETIELSVGSTLLEENNAGQHPE